jgi:SAM-dependent methyltransferase
LKHLDGAERFDFLRDTITRKAGLRMFYREVYGSYRACVARCAGVSGTVLELGSGGGFAKELLPELVTSDVIPYPGVDQVVDATKMPFGDESLKAILMFDVFHHIPDVEAFLREADRCLKPGGRVLVVDQFFGVFSRVILRYFHHEGFEPTAHDWKFESKGPLSSANGALPWIVFCRDRAKFEKLFPRLRIETIRPHSPLRYWMSGGLKRWSLLPGRLFGFVGGVEKVALKLSPKFASFFDVEIVKLPGSDA